jgi:hypothetical protein
MVVQSDFAGSQGASATGAGGATTAGDGVGEGLGVGLGLGLGLGEGLGVGLGGDTGAWATARRGITLERRTMTNKGNRTRAPKGGSRLPRGSRRR